MEPKMDAIVGDGLFYADQVIAIEVIYITFLDDIGICFPAPWLVSKDFMKHGASVHEIHARLNS